MLVLHDPKTVRQRLHVPLLLNELHLQQLVIATHLLQLSRKVVTLLAAITVPLISPVDLVDVGLDLHLQVPHPLLVRSHLLFHGHYLLLVLSIHLSELTMEDCLAL
jgi:hypothetical protein